jgi:RimJ/RimL family protein N-acetyltransferase
MIIQTKRLYLKELSKNELDLLFAILSDVETMKYYPRPYTKKEVEGWINRSIENYQTYGYGLWAVYLKDSDKFIGQCGISPQDIDGQTVPEIGYHINKAEWGRGFGSEAALGCLNYGFDTLNLPEIYIHTWIKNIPSIRIAEKLEMEKIKEYDKLVKYTGDSMRHVVYRKLAGEK